MGNTNSSLKRFRTPLLSPKEKESSRNDIILRNVTDYMKSEECTMYIEAFIDDHCLIFESNKIDDVSNDLKQEYLKLHIQYINIVDIVLSKALKKYKINHNEFRDACAIHNSRYINPEIMQFILAINDFNIFMNIMHQRNIDLEQHALKFIKQKSKNNEKNINSKSNNIINDLTSEEQMQLAILMSLEEPKKMTEEEQIKYAIQQSLQEINIHNESSDKSNNKNNESRKNIIENFDNNGSNNNQFIPNANIDKGINIIKGRNSFLTNIQAMDPNVRDYIDEEKIDENKKLKPINLSNDSGNNYSDNSNDNSGNIDVDNDKLPMLTAEDINLINNKNNNIDGININVNNNDKNIIKKNKKKILEMRKKQRKHKGYQYISLDDSDEYNDLGKSLANAFKKPKQQL